METISAQELKKRMDKGEELFILDVREPAEYEILNMGALLLPLGQIMNGEIEQIETWRDKEVIVHCKSGMRSMQACMMLEQMGFQKTVNVTGGILAWSDL